MSHLLFLQVFGWLILSLLASLSLGHFVWNGLRFGLKKIIGNSREVNGIDQLGFETTVGIGIIGYLSFGLALTGKFERSTIIVFTIAAAGLGLNYAFGWGRRLLRSVKQVVKTQRIDWVTLLALCVSILVGASLYLAAMQPPHATDELHYHFPEAKSIVETGRVSWTFDGHYFYGNIPKLMELVFAYGLEISGYSLAHTLNLAMAGSFLVMVFGMLQRRFGKKTGVLAVLLILLFEDYTWNATVGFVDAATVSMEIGSLLYLIEWALDKRDSLSLAKAGALIGLALSMKYSPVWTVLFSLLLIGWRTKRKILKPLLIYGLTGLGIGGVWYLKNLVLYHNPFYPLYLGHAGIPEDVYQSLVEAIQQFGPRTWANFFGLINHYQRYTEITVYVSLFVAPLTVLIRRSRPYSTILVVYYLLYIPYWFYSTNQIRFLMPAIIVAIILTAIQLGYWLNVKALSLLALGGLIVAIVFPAWSIAVGKEYINTKLHLVERQYALGNITEGEYLTQEFGCQYQIVEYLERNKLSGKVVDNWSVWHDPSVAYFAEYNQFVIYAPGKLPIQEMVQDLKTRGIRYLYLNVTTKGRYLAETDPLVKKTIPDKFNFEEAILPTAKLIDEPGNCRLYQLY